MKIKTISKYVLNTLNIINALLLGLIPIWGSPMGDKITASICVITGVISTYLLGDKAVKNIKGDE